MTIGKQLAQFATYSVAMAAAVALCLWVLFEPLHFGGVASGCEQSVCSPVPERRLEGGGGDFETAGDPGDSGPLVTQMQGALIKKGYSVGPADADGNFNDNTLTALEAFQDDNALPVQSKCDQQCWTALGLPGTESVRASSPMRSAF